MRHSGTADGVIPVCTGVAGPGPVDVVPGRRIPEKVGLCQVLSGCSVDQGVNADVLDNVDPIFSGDLRIAALLKSWN